MNSSCDRLWKLELQGLANELAVNLIRAVTTREGLTIQSELDENRYETGPKVTEEQLEGLVLTRDDIHGEWIYSLAPRPQDDDVI